MTFNRSVSLTLNSFASLISETPLQKQAATVSIGIIDEIPILTVAACFCNGVSEIKDARELRVKETDRLKVMARQLHKFGAEISETEDGLIINGQSKFHSAEVDSETDHRVAMSLAIASLLAKGTSKIMRADVASVSYPTFWEELAKLTN